MHDTTSTARQSVKLTVSQPLRARDAATVVRTAMRYTADITVQKHDVRADGKSRFALLGLNVQPGDKLQIIGQGEDVGQAINAFKTALASAVE